MSENTIFSVDESDLDSLLRNTYKIDYTTLSEESKSLIRQTAFDYFDNLPWEAGLEEKLDGIALKALRLR